MTGDRIERDVFIEATVQRVWEVLTGVEHMREWFGGATATLDLRPGGAAVFHWAEHGTFHAVVERVEAPHVLAYRWSLLPDLAVAAGTATRVEFTLDEESGGTRLRVVETGFSELAGGDTSRERHLTANRAGWDAALEELCTYASAARAS